MTSFPFSLVDLEIVMDSRSFKGTSYKKKQTLHSLGVGFVFFLVLYIITKFSNKSVCLINNIFGKSCFGCGMTRGFLSIINLDFRSAFQYNVLSIPLFFGILFYGFFAFFDVVFDTNFIFHIEKILGKRYMFIVYIMALIIATFLKNIM